MTESTDLDAFDHRILAVVRRNNLEPARTVAGRVGLSESAVLRRLRRLRAIGVIVADVAVIDDEVLAADKDVRMFETLVSLREIVRFDPLRADRLI